MKPSGAAVTESPWDIHTVCSAGSPASRVPASDTVTAVRPNSDEPVLRDLAAQSAWAIAWKP